MALWWRDGSPDAVDEGNVVLGFAGRPPGGSDAVDAYASRYGGRPVRGALRPRGRVRSAQQVWLAGGPPPAEQLQCAHCQQPMSFVMQLFAPIWGASPEAEHRVLYWFFCGCRAPVGRCTDSERAGGRALNRGSWSVIRCQMAAQPRPQPQPQQRDDDLADWGGGGDWGTSTDAAEAEALVDQLLDARDHQQPQQPEEQRGDSRAGTAAEEEEAGGLYIETAAEPDKASTATTPGVDGGGGGSGAGDDGEASWAAEPHEDTPPDEDILVRFASRLAREPAQLLRYSLCGRPLWMSVAPPHVFPGDDRASDAAAPRCLSCGGDCVFEMQLMPSAVVLAPLPCFGPDTAADWGGAALYSCRHSCSVASGCCVEHAVVPRGL